MLSTNYDMTHINYQNLKDRMSETSKGFWKVQSIHRLTTKLKIKYNPKDYIILKTIKKPPPKIPPFIFFRHEESPKKKKLENQKNNSCGSLTVQNFFITGTERNKILKEKEEKNKTLLNKIYGKFTYEPFLYNEFQFFCLKKEKRLLPRKFKDVVKDCIALREYKKYINNMQRKNLKNIIAQSEFINKEIQKSNKNSMTVICKRNLSYNEILNNVFGEHKNEDSNLSETNIKNWNGKYLKEKKCFSLENIKTNKFKFMIKSKIDKNKKRISLPKLNIKKKFKMKVSNIE